MRFIAVSLAAGAALLLAGSASAHHSGAMFDGRKIVTLSGTLKEIQWTNPHSWLELEVPQASGAPQQWSVEMGWPEAMFKQGFRRNDPKPGDKISVSIHPLRDGRPGGAFVSVTLADGRVIGGGRGA
jgi:hypothetical protein